jgi:hypothetical protein
VPIIHYVTIRGKKTDRFGVLRFAIGPKKAKKFKILSSFKRDPPVVGLDSSPDQGYWPARQLEFAEDGHGEETLRIRRDGDGDSHQCEWLPALL